jgi:hypothetical protein
MGVPALGRLNIIFGTSRDLADITYNQSCKISFDRLSELVLGLITILYHTSIAILANESDLVINSVLRPIFV